MQNNLHEQRIFCVDIGGTKTAFSCFDEQGNELFYERFPTCPEQGAETLVSRIYEHAKKHLTTHRFKMGVIASPGPLNAETGEILHIATMGWKNVPLTKLFENKFSFPFRLLNDCDAGALGARKLCGLQDKKSVCYMSVSTGIGGGMVLGGKLYTGKGNAADFGHIPVHGLGLVCPCGKKDCLELYASGAGIERRYREKTGTSISCAEIADRARNGDSFCIELFREAGEKISFALSSLVAIVDPEALVLGGSVCLAKDLFIDEIKKRLPSLKIFYAPESGKQVLVGANEYGKE